MLTDQQIEELEPLTKHPKYGKLLSDTVEVWKRDDVIPANSQYGVWVRRGKFVFSDISKKCCILGAALVNKEYDSDWCGLREAISNFFEVYPDEQESISKGFDNFPKISATVEEAWEFGNQIFKIINPISD